MCHVDSVVGPQDVGEPSRRLSIASARNKEENVVTYPDDVCRIKDDLIFFQIVVRLIEAVTEPLPQGILGHLQRAPLPIYFVDVLATQTRKRCRYPAEA